MTPPVGIDPGAVLQRADGSREYVEVALATRADGRLELRLELDDGTLETIALRDGFLDEFIADAASEAAA